MARITLQHNTYNVFFSYDAGLVQQIKNSIPGHARHWDPLTHTWQIDTQYERVLRRIFPNDHIPINQQVATATETRIIDLRFLGQARMRGQGDISAYGWSQGQWSVVFSEAVLRAWFEGIGSQQALHGRDTLYGMLGVAVSATAETIKTAYRRAAKQWHPDVCKEQNAGAIFLRMKEAYEILSNEGSRARYDAGMALEATLAVPQKKVTDMSTYRAPLKCGMLIVEGEQHVGKFAVRQIIAWEDIVDTAGRTLVTSWPIGVDAPVEEWA